jgi:hypothetical protein
MLDEPVDDLCLPACLSKAVSVDCGNGAASDLKSGSERVELKAEVALPESAVPSVMISSHHDYWHSASEPRQRGGHVKAASWDDP